MTEFPVNSTPNWAGERPIPMDVMQEALSVAEEALMDVSFENPASSNATWSKLSMKIALAILAERDRCAAKLEEMADAAESQPVYYWLNQGAAAIRGGQNNG